MLRMNGFAFCEESRFKHEDQQHRYHLPDATKWFIVSNIRSTCDRNLRLEPSLGKGQSRSTLVSIFISTCNRMMKLEFAIALLCCVCYFNALSCDFVFDDISAIKENQDLRPETPLSQLLLNDFWGQPMVKEHSHKSYRPICVFTFRLNYALHQLAPFGYHLVNVILHVVVSILYFRFCRLIMSSKSSFLASVLFSIHPIHTEAVTSAVGRAETLCAVFYLLSVILYSRSTRGTTSWPLLMASIGCAALATFSKEQGITALAFCCIFEVVCNQKLHQSRITSVRFYINHKGMLQTTCPRWIKKMALRIVILVTAAILMMAIRLRVMQSQLPVFTRFDNPAAHAPTPIRQMTHNYLLALNAWLLLNPLHLCCDWTMGSIALVESIHDVRNMATFFLYLTLCALIWKAGKSRDEPDCVVIVIALSLIIVAFLPASNLFFFVGFVIAERVLYIPSFGFCMLVAFGFNKLFSCHSLQASTQSKMVKFLLSFALFSFIVCHSWRTILRNEDWQNEMKIFTSGIQINPLNAKLFNNVGHVLEAQQKHSEALHYFLNATHIQPNDLGGLLNVGRTYANLGKKNIAEKYFRAAKDLMLAPKVGYEQKSYARIAPSHLNLFIDLASLISQNNSRLAEAEQLYVQAIRMRPDFIDAYINYADILLKLNRTDEAEKVYKKALSYDQQNADIYYNLGVVAIEIGDLKQAIAFFDKAIRINDNHEQALLNFAIVVQDDARTDLFDIAELRLRRLLTLGLVNERIYFHLGMIAMSTERHDQAEKWFKMAVQLKPDFRSATFNLALLLSNTNRPLEAMLHLERLVLHHPNHIKGLTLLCDILINNVKNMDRAEVCYERILKLDPVNIQARHNLCVVYVEQEKLNKAEHCLLIATQIAPSQHYIDRHLKVVRLRILRLKQTKASD